MASSAIPGIFEPINIDGKLLVDGGIVENIPIKTLHTMGSEYTIAVDLSSKYLYEKPKNAIEVILNSFHFLMMQSCQFQTEKSDLLIKPDLSSFSRSNISQVKRIISKGYENAKEVFGEIDKFS